MQERVKTVFVQCIKAKESPLTPAGAGRKQHRSAGRWPRGRAARREGKPGENPAGMRGTGRPSPSFRRGRMHLPARAPRLAPYLKADVVFKWRGGDVGLESTFPSEQSLY